MPKNKQKWKMTPEELELWLHYRKKCAVHKSKKDYNRKEKHKQSYDMQDTTEIKCKGLHTSFEMKKRSSSLIFLAR